MMHILNGNIAYNVDTIVKKFIEFEYISNDEWQFAVSQDAKNKSLRIKKALHSMKKIKINKYKPNKIRQLYDQQIDLYKHDLKAAENFQWQYYAMVDYCNKIKEERNKFESISLTTDYKGKAEIRDELIKANQKIKELEKNIMNSDVYKSMEYDLDDLLKKYHRLKKEKLDEVLKNEMVQEHIENQIRSISDKIVAQKRKNPYELTVAQMRDVKRCKDFQEYCELIINTTGNLTLVAIDLEQRMDAKSASINDLIFGMTSIFPSSHPEDFMRSIIGDLRSIVDKHNILFKKVNINKNFKLLELTYDVATMKKFTDLKNDFMKELNRFIESAVGMVNQDRRLTYVFGMIKPSVFTTELCKLYNSLDKDITDYLGMSYDYMCEVFEVHRPLDRSNEIIKLPISIIREDMKVSKYYKECDTTLNVYFDFMEKIKGDKNLMKEYNHLLEEAETYLNTKLEPEDKFKCLSVITNIAYYDYQKDLKKEKELNQKIIKTLHMKNEQLVLSEESLTRQIEIGKKMLIDKDKEIVELKSKCEEYNKKEKMYVMSNRSLKKSNLNLLQNIRQKEIALCISMSALFLQSGGKIKELEEKLKKVTQEKDKFKDYISYVHKEIEIKKDEIKKFKEEKAQNETKLIEYNRLKNNKYEDLYYKEKEKNEDLKHDLESYVINEEKYMTMNEVNNRLRESHDHLKSLYDESLEKITELNGEIERLRLSDTGSIRGKKSNLLTKVSELSDKMNKMFDKFSSDNEKVDKKEKKVKIPLVRKKEDNIDKSSFKFLKNLKPKVYGIDADDDRPVYVSTNSTMLPNMSIIAEVGVVKTIVKEKVKMASKSERDINKKLISILDEEIRQILEEKYLPTKYQSKIQIVMSSEEFDQIRCVNFAQWFFEYQKYRDFYNIQQGKIQKKDLSKPDTKSYTDDQIRIIKEEAKAEFRLSMIEKQKRDEEANKATKKIQEENKALEFKDMSIVVDWNCRYFKKYQKLIKKFDEKEKDLKDQIIKLSTKIGKMTAAEMGLPAHDLERNYLDVSERYQTMRGEFLAYKKMYNDDTFKEKYTESVRKFMKNYSSLEESYYTRCTDFNIESYNRTKLDMLCLADLSKNFEYFYGNPALNDEEDKKHLKYLDENVSKTSLEVYRMRKQIIKNTWGQSDMDKLDSRQKSFIDNWTFNVNRWLLGEKPELDEIRKLDIVQRYDSRFVECDESDDDFYDKI